MTSSLLARLLLAYLLPTLVLFALFAFFAYRFTEQRLEAALGQRLIGMAQVLAGEIRGDAVMFLGPGDEETRTARRIQSKLRDVAARTGVARILIIDRAHRSRADTRAQFRIGERVYQSAADSVELAAVFSGQAASSVLFFGADKTPYKTGYAPITDGETVVAALGVEGSASFFAELEQPRLSLLAAGGLIALLVAGISLLLARRITRPLRLLAAEAARMGSGQLEAPIALTAADEVGLLARTMNTMREALFARDQALQMMLAGIAHEVRNPLGGIALFTGLLRDELKGDATKLSLLQRIERELDYLKNVVEEFLAYTRKRPLACDVVDLAMLLGQVADLAAPHASGKQVSLAVRLESAPATLTTCGDAEQLRRVLLNVVQNAVQASTAGSQVTLTAAAQNDVLVLTVQDSGCGMTPDILEKIAQPFFTTRERGTGLGLAISAKIVKEHGGTLAVESTPAQGTTVCVRLPRTHEAQP